jgi:type I restriction enzyme, S subunit
MKAENEVPQGWKSAYIEDIVDVTRPVTYGVVQPGERQPIGIPLIRGRDYSSGEVSTDDLYLIHPNIAHAYRRSVVRDGDILLSIVGYVGQCAMVPRSLSGANITQTTARIAISKGYSNRFFLHQFRGSAFQAEVRRFMKGSAQPGLNLADVDQMRVLVPPPREQRKIAEILDNADEAIRCPFRGGLNLCHSGIAAVR